MSGSRESDPNNSTAGKSAAGIGCLAVIVLTVATFGWCVSASRKNKSDEWIAPLQSSVAFTGTQFLVESLDPDEWTDVELEINRTATFSDDGFSVSLGTIRPFKTVTIGALQLSKQDGTRFNPLQFRPRTFRLSATVKGNRRFAFGEFK